MPGVQQRAAAGAVVGVDDARDRAIDGPAQQRRLPRAGHAGDDDTASEGKVRSTAPIVRAVDNTRFSAACE